MELESTDGVSEAPATLVAALQRLPNGPERGFRFIGFGSSERYLSYDEIRREAWRRAAHLHALGLNRGDRLALAISDGPEFVLDFVGAVLAGVVPVPLFPPSSARAADRYGETVAGVVASSGARALLTNEAGRAMLQPALEKLPGLERILTTETAFSESAPDFPPPDIAPDDLCFLQYTSGSTAQPKGVMITHRNLVTNAIAFCGREGLDCGPQDLGVSWLPLFHDMGLIGFVLTPLICDVPVVILSTNAFGRDPRIWLRTIDKYRGTITYAPNFAYALVVKRLRDEDVASLDLSCLRVAGCGAEPIHAPTLRAFAERLGPAGFSAEAFLPSYGLAESTLAVTFHGRARSLHTEIIDTEALQRGEAEPASDASRAATELVSCGASFRGHDLAIVDEAGARLPERRVGEILISGPSVSSGYWNAEAATAEAWTDGWHRTGDLGYLSGGNLFVCGRIKDLIIIRGANFYPQEIEWAVKDLPGVRRGNVAAFGAPRDGAEMLVVAAEVDPRDASGLRGRIAARVLETVGVEVGHVALVASGSLPKTSSGKMQRRQAKKLFESGQLLEIGAGVGAQAGESSGVPAGG